MPSASSSTPRWWLWLGIAVVAGGILVWQLYPRSTAVPANLRVRVIRSFPHDREAYTQGLVWHEGALYESTGMRGRSTLRRVALETGEPQRVERLPDHLFGEGLAVVGSELVQLTWRGGKALVWDLATFELLREHEYRGEGWGLCYDGQRLVMSDGSAWLTFRDPETFEEIGEVRVTRAGRPVRRLNELECVEGSVYANVWMTDHIAQIDPDSGHVIAWIDAAGLLSEADRDGSEDVLNGIAHLPESGHLLLTCKQWSKLYEVELVPAP